MNEKVTLFVGWIGEDIPKVLPAKNYSCGDILGMWGGSLLLVFVCIFSFISLSLSPHLFLAVLGYTKLWIQSTARTLMTIPVLWYVIHIMMSLVYLLYFQFFSVILAIISVVYVLYVLWAIGKAYKHTRTIPLLSLR